MYELLLLLFLSPPLFPTAHQDFETCAALLNAAFFFSLLLFYADG